MLLISKSLFIVLWFMLGNAPENQSFRLVGGPCEGCEAIFEFGTRQLSSIDTLIDFGKVGPKLKLTGTVFQPDGKTPAEGIILYIYHTNQSGVYPTRGDEKGWARRHGYIRGWIKTDKKGQYTFYTLRPGTYPSRSEPAHIHITVLEPDGKYYWINSYYFDDDPLLSEKDRIASLTGRGGSGILKLERTEAIWVGKRDIVLGKNVPGY
jgi:protocatechuate 3,4-dioxygenase beta subunit